METNNIKGRRIVLWIAVLTISASTIIDFLNFLIQDDFSFLEEFIPFIISVVLAIFMYRGNNWARLIWVLLYIFAGFTTLFATIFVVQEMPWFMVFTVLYLILCFVVAYLLLFNEDVVDHFES